MVSFVRSAKCRPEIVRRYGGVSVAERCPLLKLMPMIGGSMSLFDLVAICDVCHNAISPVEEAV
jgi:hypothetical protein